MKDKTPTENRLKQLNRESTGIAILGLISMAYIVFLFLLTQANILSSVFAGAFPLADYSLSIAQTSLTGIIMTLIALIALYFIPSRIISFTLTTIYAAVTIFLWRDALWSANTLLIAAISLQVISMYTYTMLVKK